MNGRQVWLCDCVQPVIGCHCEMFEAIGYMWSIPAVLIAGDEMLLDQGSKL